MIPAILLGAVASLTMLSGLPRRVPVYNVVSEVVQMRQR